MKFFIWPSCPLSDHRPAFKQRVNGVERWSDVTTLCYMENGIEKEQISYSLIDTPCERIVGKPLPTIFPQNVDKLFPLDRAAPPD